MKLERNNASANCEKIKIEFQNLQLFLESKTKPFSSIFQPDKNKASEPFSRRLLAGILQTTNDTKCVQECGTRINTTFKREESSSYPQVKKEILTQNTLQLEVVERPSSCNRRYQSMTKTECFKFLFRLTCHLTKESTNQLSLIDETKLTQRNVFNFLQKQAKIKHIIRSSITSPRLRERDRHPEQKAFPNAGTALAKINLINIPVVAANTWILSFVTFIKVTQLFEYSAASREHKYQRFGGARRRRRRRNTRKPAMTI